MKLTILHTGQTGVARGAHLGALDGGLPIAGWMPRGKHDELGPIPADVAQHLIPCTVGIRDGGFLAATGANVEWATHVLMVVQDCRKIASTREAALIHDLARDELYGRPWIAVDPDIPSAQLKDWIARELKILRAADRFEMRLLVAGPRASHWEAGEISARTFVASLGNALACFVHAGGGLGSLPEVDGGGEGFSPT